MYKFFVENSQINNDKITIIGEDVNHIINVLRLRGKENIQVCNENTSENYICEILDYSKDYVTCKIIEKLNKSVESNVKLDIYQGLPKTDKMELIIQKTVEIGVKKVIPVQMERCIVKIEDKDKIKKIDRWQKIAEVAAKQSKRDIIPKIEDIKSLDYVCNNIKEYDCFLVAYEDEKNIKLKQILKDIPKKKKLKIGVLIGPEGGITLKEIEKLEQNNAKIVSLGSRILRTETAPIVASSIILYELEN